jgi:hypothetical protein
VQQLLHGSFDLRQKPAFQIQGMQGDAWESVFSEPILQVA